MKDVQEALNEVVDLVTDSVRKTSVLGARALILGQFHNAAMPYLTKAQRLEVTRTFRVGVENAMSLTDDVALPAEYHSTLLDLTNSILRELEKEPAKRR